MHLLDNKRLSSSKLLQMKLAFSLEQIFSFAKLAYEFECLEDNQKNKPILFTVLHYSAQFIQALLTDPVIQVNIFQGVF